jgi:hypothetical protein
MWQCASFLAQDMLHARMAARTASVHNVQWQISMQVTSIISLSTCAWRVACSASWHQAPAHAALPARRAGRCTVLPALTLLPWPPSEAGTPAASCTRPATASMAPGPAWSRWGHHAHTHSAAVQQRNSHRPACAGSVLLMLGEPGGCLAAQLLPLMHATVVVAI